MKPDHATGDVNVVEGIGEDKQVVSDAGIGNDAEEQRHDTDHQRTVETAAYPPYTALLVLVVEGFKLLHARLVVLAECKGVEGDLRDVGGNGIATQGA